LSRRRCITETTLSTGFRRPDAGATFVVKSDDKGGMMRARRMRPGGSLWTLVGAALGALVGGTVLAWGPVLASGGSIAAGSSRTIDSGLREVLHTPPLLVERGAKVTLRYEAVCEADLLGAPCALTGTAYVRRFGELAFSRVPLSAGVDSSLNATLPASTTTSGGFAYYAVVNDGTAETTVPAGGERAPARVWAMPTARTIDLGTHAFGRTRAPDRTVVEGPWGSGDGAFGLLADRTQAAIGPSAFDLTPDGHVVVLDQLNARAVVYGGGSMPRYLPISFEGVEGDLAIGADGGVYVLGGTGTAPEVRAFTSDGTRVDAARVAADGADMLRAGPGGVLAHGYPGDVWVPLGRSGALLRPSEQLAMARPGRSILGGEEVIVKADEGQDVFALVRGDHVVRAWRVTSSTPLGEVQLAEPFGDGLVAVVRVWLDQRAEFAVLVLSPTGLERSFSLDAVEWAESAPLGRFRLFGTTLYQLRSAREGVDISAIDLGGVR
jgi:hypothetical protein